MDAKTLIAQLRHFGWIDEAECVERQAAELAALRAELTACKADAEQWRAMPVPGLESLPDFVLDDAIAAVFGDRDLGMLRAEVRAVARRVARAAIDAARSAGGGK